jgi:hypothetical protein
MKRRLLLISLVLVLMLTVLTPATALAYSGWHVPTGSFTGFGQKSFTGSGQLYVTYMPDPIIKGNIWCYQGEVVQGLLDQCDWDLLAPTVFYSTHDSVVRVDGEGNAGGLMRGTFTLTRPDGTGVLEGTFTGRIQGNLYTGDISDTGTWISTKGTGVFEKVRAWGQWSAELSFGPIPGTDIYTLIGPVTWEGKYIGPIKAPDIIKPGKPIQPWKKMPIEPGKPIKPWKPITLWKPIIPEKP